MPWSLSCTDCRLHRSMLQSCVDTWNIRSHSVCIAVCTADMGIMMFYKPLWSGKHIFTTISKLYMNFILRTDTWSNKHCSTPITLHFMSCSFSFNISVDYVQSVFITLQGTMCARVSINLTVGECDWNIFSVIRVDQRCYCWIDGNM